MGKLSSNGQALIEYVLIISLISVVVIGAVKIFGGHLKDSITKASCSIINQEYVEGDSPGEGYCTSDYDFME
ncbi:MAG: Flp family type IVb pilin [bacterium]